jgi:hypothetical protein
VQENTAGFCSVDGSIDNNNSGFTGTGFANTTNAAGKGVNWRVNILTAGSYTLPGDTQAQAADRKFNY